MTNVSSWVESANGSRTGFPIQNLPYTLFRTPESKLPSLGVGIGDTILDLRRCADAGLLASLPLETQEACRALRLNALMALGRTAWSGLRTRIGELLGTTDEHWRSNREAVEPLLSPMAQAEFFVPADIRNYTDFYASIHHAVNVGRIFRPEQPLFPNYHYLPIAYHGRASSIVVNGTPIPRPSGQRKPRGAAAPVFGPTQSLDFELEVGLFIGPGNGLGKPISIDDAESHIFGLSLLNDWSARDIQSWEYRPLGPFLSKSFATSISPWVVPMEAVKPFRVQFERPPNDPELLPYLQPSIGTSMAFDVKLQAELTSRGMRELGCNPLIITKSNLRYLFWTLPQLITHHTSNGCNLLPGDLLATGTLSGPTTESQACLLELTNGGLDELQLPSGESRIFLQTGDEIVIRGWCEKDGIPRISFGDCRGVVR
jgi:fumarylacetoacetase